MYKILLTLFFIICSLGCSGCRLLESAVSNVGGWDISACIGGLDICWELFLDNSDKFEDGFVDAIDTLVPAGE